jgi:TonB family protein
MTTEMPRYSLLLFLILAAIPALGQGRGTIYFDSNWKECKPEQALYFREYIQTSDSLYYLEDHYINGNIRMRGRSFGYRDPLRFVDTVLYYYSNGRKEIQRSYVKGIQEGEQMEWYPDGHIKTEGTFQHGQLNGIWRGWYRNNVLYDSGRYVNGLQEGEWVSRHQNGQLEDRGTYVHGKKVGTWNEWYDGGEPEGTLVNDTVHGTSIQTWYDRSGKICAVEEFKDTSMVAARYIDEDGTEHHDRLKAWTDPQFGNDDNSYIRFMNSNLKYPELARRNNIEGKVVLVFLLTDKGDVQDVEVTDSANRLFDEEAIRVVQQMKEWKPARKHNRPASTYVSIPITFRLR